MIIGANNHKGVLDLLAMTVSLYGMQMGWSEGDTMGVHELLKKKEMGSMPDPVTVHEVLDKLYEQVKNERA